MTKPMLYTIRVRDHLNSGWSHWFEDLTISHDPNGETLITGPVRDQAALFGVLMKVRDLGVTLISVNCLNPEQSRPDVEEF
jgi:hypothetical protein